MTTQAQKDDTAAKRVTRDDGVLNTGPTLDIGNRLQFPPIRPNSDVVEPANRAGDRAPACGPRAGGDHFKQEFMPRAATGIRHYYQLLFLNRFQLRVIVGVIAHQAFDDLAQRPFAQRAGHIGRTFKSEGA